jgi:general L-amino acid transport system substrate-binding protein
MTTRTFTRKAAMRRWFAALACSVLAAAPALAQAPASPTLAEVRARGQLVCGVNGGLPGFSAPDPQGVTRGFDADFCRAVAAATLGSADRVRFVPQATPEAGLDALAARQIDLLVRNTTVTITRDGQRPVTPGPVIFFDGAGFLVPRSLNLASPRNLAGRTVCFAGAEGGATDAALDDFAARHALTWTERRFATPAEVVAAMRAGQCHAFVADQAALATRRVTDFPDPDNWVVLPEVISQEPLAPWVRNTDDAWRAIIHWTAQALIQAEGHGVTSRNLPEFLARQDATMRRFMGLEPGFGAPLGLADDWIARVIAGVGNYGEIFDRNLGAGSVFGKDRGLNDQWTRGGLIYGMPFR